MHKPKTVVIALSLFSLSSQVLASVHAPSVLCPMVYQPAVCRLTEYSAEGTNSCFARDALQNQLDSYDISYDPKEIRCVRSERMAVRLEDWSSRFDDTFITVASYLVQGPDGQLLVNLPAAIDADVDAEILASLITSLESHNANLRHIPSSQAEDSLRFPGAKKLVIIGFRHGGPVVARVVGKLNKKWGTWVGKNADRIADMLEAIDNWAEGPIILGLMKMGMPYPEAKLMAEIIVSLV